jgi:biotin operon repressor
MKDLNIVFKAEYFDANTGEYITREVSEEELVKMLTLKDTKKRRRAIKEFYGEKVMIFQEILKKAVKELKGDELKVFNYMLGVMDFENWINISQKDIAKEIGIHKVNVSKAIKGLKEKGYIEIIKKGRENYYRINPEVAWKGDEKSHLKVLRNNNPLIG